MAIIKKYIMRNVEFARVQFKLGNDFIVNAEFKDGDSIHGIPASLVTNDPRVQMAIENDKNMFGKSVLLEWQDGTADVRPSTGKGKKTLTINDVTTIDDVKNYLIENHGFSRNIKSIDDLKAKVEEFGLEFPNFHFE